LDDLLERVEAWHRASQHKKIIKAVEGIPAERRGYELTGLLARALINVGDRGRGEFAVRSREALRLLESVSAQGEDDWVWHYQMGVVLVKLECGHEAEDHLLRCLALDGPSEDVHPILEQAREDVAARRAHAEEVCAHFPPPGPKDEVLHLLFTADEESARTAAAAVERNGYTISEVISARAAGMRRQAGRKGWVVVAVRRDVTVTPEYLYTTRAFFESLALRVSGGAYDGWEADAWRAE